MVLWKEAKKFKTALGRKICTNWVRGKPEYQESSKNMQDKKGTCMMGEKMRQEQVNQVEACRTKQGQILKRKTSRRHKRFSSIKQNKTEAGLKTEEQKLGIE